MRDGRRRAVGRFKERTGREVDPLLVQWCGVHGATAEAGVNGKAAAAPAWRRRGLSGCWAAKPVGLSASMGRRRKKSRNRSG
jgi:hypothetical protein